MDFITQQEQLMQEQNQENLFKLIKIAVGYVHIGYPSHCNHLGFVLPATSHQREQRDWTFSAALQFVSHIPAEFNICKYQEVLHNQGRCKTT